MVDEGEGGHGGERVGVVRAEGLAVMLEDFAVEGGGLLAELGVIGVGS